MNLDELKKDLLEKTSNSAFFTKKLFKKDKYIYMRRSFNDLFIYYKQFNVTEKMLLQALYELKFSASVCNTLKKVVFSKVYPQIDKFWGKHFFNLNYGYLNKTDKTAGKYTINYLNNLFKKIY